MKKLMIVSAVVLVAVVALGVAGFAYAQSQTPTTPQPGTMGGAYGRGMMGRWAQSGQVTAPGLAGQGMGFRGQMAGTGEGPLHDYMIDGFAQAFEMTPDQIEARLDAGDTIWTIAQEKGLTPEQFATLMTQVRTDALNQAVTDGVITQAQADFMLQRTAQMQANGFGPGSGNCVGGGAGRGAGRMFRNQVPAQP